MATCLILNQNNIFKLVYLSTRLLAAANIFFCLPYFDSLTVALIFIAKALEVSAQPSCTCCCNPIIKMLHLASSRNTLLCNTHMLCACAYLCVCVGGQTRDV